MCEVNSNMPGNQTRTREAIIISESIGYLESMRRNNQLAKDMARSMETKDHMNGVILGLDIALEEIKRLRELLSEYK